MAQRFLKSCLIALLGFSCSSVAIASMRCPGGNLVDLGDSQTAVLASCGKPSSTLNTSIPHHNRSISVHRWVYIPRKGKFIRYVDFKGGKVISISHGPRVK